MIDRLRNWYRALSGREQRLVAIAGVLAVITLVWSLTVVLLAATDSAQSRYADAVRRLADTEARLSAVQALTRAPAPPPAGAIDVVVRDRASAAGFTLSNDTPGADGSVNIAIAAAKPAALLAWIAALEQSGLLVQRLSTTDNGDRTLAVQMTLKRRGA